MAMLAGAARHMADAGTSAAQTLAAYMKKSRREIGIDSGTHGPPLPAMAAILIREAPGVSE